MSKSNNQSNGTTNKTFNFGLASDNAKVTNYAPVNQAEKIYDVNFHSQFGNENASGTADPQKDHPSPAGPAAVDDQGNSGTCTRFAIAKAISNFLFVKEKIDIEQSNIVSILVQAKKDINGIHPDDYNGFELYLQDVKNDYKVNGKKLPDKSWWKVKLSLNDVTKQVNDDKATFDDDGEHLLVYSVNELNSKQINTPDKSTHCVYVQRRYKCIRSNMANKEIYECLNSWGFKDPILFIDITNPAIKRLLKVTLKVDALKYE